MYVFCSHMSPNMRARMPACVLVHIGLRTKNAHGFMFIA